MNYFVELLLNMVICILVSLYFFYCAGSKIRRAEKIYMKFRVPLREGHPKEYLKQNKFIKFIRKLSKLSTYDTLHYSIIILHYIQFVILCTPLCLCLFGFSVFESEMMYFIAIALESLIFMLVWDTHLAVKEFRCRKIRKTNPKYSKYSMDERWTPWHYWIIWCNKIWFILLIAIQWKTK